MINVPTDQRSFWEVTSTFITDVGSDSSWVMSHESSIFNLKLADSLTQDVCTQQTPKVLRSTQLTRHAFHAWQCSASSHLSVMWLKQIQIDSRQTWKIHPKHVSMHMLTNIFSYFPVNSKVQTEIARCQIVRLLWQVGSKAQNNSNPTSLGSDGSSLPHVAEVKRIAGLMSPRRYHRTIRGRKKKQGYMKRKCCCCCCWFFFASCYAIAPCPVKPPGSVG